MSDAAISINNLSLRLGRRLVFDQLSLEIPKNKITVVVGGSGSGKSTLLKCIMGFVRPNSGSIYLDGTDITQLSTKDKQVLYQNIGMSFQYAALFDSLSVFDNVALPLREHTKLGKSEIYDQVMQALSRVGLINEELKMPAELSGGMRKRVGIARAIIVNPKVMLFDEPESGLDPITTTAIGELIVELKEAFNMSCLVISHRIHTIKYIADKICMLYHGKIITEGSAPEVENSTNPIVRQFFSGSTEGPYTAL